MRQTRALPSMYNVGIEQNHARVQDKRESYKKATTILSQMPLLVHYAEIGASLQQ